MRNDDELVAESFRQFRYDPETGRVYSRRTGSVVGHKDPNGYLRTVVVLPSRRQNMVMHRLAWVLYYGSMPGGIVDHINGDRVDNRITNLRVVSPTGNALNARHTRISASGYVGVEKRRGKWAARIRMNTTLVWLGTFSTAEQAHRAYLAARQAHEAEHLPSAQDAPPQRTAYEPLPSPQLGLFP